MKFKQIINRLTGLSTPVFGVSWNPPQSHITVARDVITFLEDRRVLYNPYDLEVPSHCVHSVIEIRHYLTAQVAKLADDSGPLRGVIGVHVAALAVQYGLDVEGELATILPAEDNQKE